jgi:hypothetical protein
VGILAEIAASLHMNNSAVNSGIARLSQMELLHMVPTITRTIAMKRVVLNPSLLGNTPRTVGDSVEEAVIECLRALLNSTLGGHRIKLTFPNNVPYKTATTWLMNAGLIKRVLTGDTFRFTLAPELHSAMLGSEKYLLSTVSSSKDSSGDRSGDPRGTPPIQTGDLPPNITRTFAAICLFQEAGKRPYLNQKRLSAAANALRDCGFKNITVPQVATLLGMSTMDLLRFPVLLSKENIETTVAEPSEPCGSPEMLMLATKILTATGQKVTKLALENLLHASLSGEIYIARQPTHTARTSPPARRDYGF